MKIEGLNVDTGAIGRGLYRLIVAQGQEAIVAFGMLPADVMEIAEKEMREKIVALIAEQMGASPADVVEFVDEAKLKAILKPIMHQLSVEIFAAASDAGKMVV